MKAKLNKIDNGYVLLVDNIMYATDNDKLSKENCDEIFEVVDVEKLAQMDIHNVKPINPHPHSYFSGFIRGFNKAMELNKDKLFTVEDMYYIFQLGFSLNGKSISKLEYDAHIKSLQQPTEIEIEIEMECKIGCDNFIFNGDKSICCGNKIKKLDSNENLILRKL